MKKAILIHLTVLILYGVLVISLTMDKRTDVMGWIVIAYGLIFTQILCRAIRYVNELLNKKEP